MSAHKQQDTRGTYKTYFMKRSVVFKHCHMRTEKGVNHSQTSRKKYFCIRWQRSPENTVSSGYSREINIWVVALTYGTHPQ